MPDHTLLTGATGLLGRYLLRNLLSQGTPVAVVVRPAAKLSAVERIEEILALWESQSNAELPRPRCLSGDIRSEGLGLDAEDRSWIANNCDRVIHSAAVLSLSASTRDGEPWATNLDGTRRVLDLCSSAGIGDLHYVSTAYVSGRREGRVLESQLDEGQEFRNDYEASKLEAEQLVRAADHLESPTVYRPAVISGDSNTGYTSTYHGLYLYLRLMALVVPRQPIGEDGLRHTPIRLPMSGDEPRNVVPVDWVAEVMTHLLNTPEARGGTYHLAPEVPLTPRAIIDACYKYFHSTGVQYVGQDYRHDPSDMSEFERLLLENITVYDAYTATDPVFDRTNLKRFASHLPCPTIDEATLHRYLTFAEEDRWGRKHQTDPQ